MANSSNNKFELIELFLTGETGTKDEDFRTKFNTLLDRTTFIGSTSKPEYWMGFFLGGLASLGGTQALNQGLPLGVGSVRNF